MKKFLYISVLSLFIPAYASCNLEDLDNNSVCSIQNLRKNINPIYTHNSNVSEFSSNPESRLQPIKRSDIEETTRTFEPTESDYSYNTSCQFGVCLQNRKAPLFKK